MLCSMTMDQIKSIITTRGPLNNQAQTHTILKVHTKQLTALICSLSDIRGSLFNIVKI